MVSLTKWSFQKFVSDYEEFMTKVADWDKRLGFIICQAFDDCGNPQAVFKVCRFFYRNLKLPNISYA